MNSAVLPGRSFAGWIWLAVKSILILIVLLVVGVMAFLYLAPTFGGDASGDSLERL